MFAKTVAKNSVTAINLPTKEEINHRRSHVINAPINQIQVNVTITPIRKNKISLSIIDIFKLISYLYSNSPTEVNSSSINNLLNTLTNTIEL